MARTFKRYPSFGREDKLVGIRAFFNGQSFIPRLIVFVILGGIFFLVAQMAYKDVKSSPPPSSEDSSVAAPKTPPSK